jgi:hypothetical protein
MKRAISGMELGIVGAKGLKAEAEKEPNQLAGNDLGA